METFLNSTNAFLIVNDLSDDCKIGDDIFVPLFYVVTPILFIPTFI